MLGTQTGVSPGAYQGKLTCPHLVNDKGQRDRYGTKICGSEALRYIEHVNPWRLRYRCRKCGGTLQYDISNRIGGDPYAPYKKGTIWKDIERGFRFIRGLK